MTNLANDPPTALDRVLYPTITRNAARTHAVKDRERRLTRCKEFRCDLRRWRKAAVVADQEPPGRILCGIEHSIELFVIHRERLFDEDVLPFFQGKLRQSCVCIVPSGDDN